MDDYTLQINLSPGDLDYAPLTVPALIEAHPGAAERLLIVDVCKPQRTRIVDPEKRFPEPRYSERARGILEFADKLRAAGSVDRIEVLRPGDERIEHLRRRYLRPWVMGTHDYGACAMMAYFAAFEFCRTRWLLHYDADMLQHQAPGVDWTVDVRRALESRPELVAGMPRYAPPLPVDQPDAPSLDEGMGAKDYPEGWGQTWFSTRCYLFELERLRPLLPLVQGRVWWELLLTRLLRRGFPRSPEILLFRRMGAAGRQRLCLRRRDAWLLHPVEKGERFRRLLPGILEAVRAGKCPPAQLGRQNLMLDAWEAADVG